MPQFKAWTVRITLSGPISTASSSPRGMGIDVPFARNSEDQYYIPGTLVKGRLKEALKELNAVTGGTTCPRLFELLGKDAAASGMEQDRALVYFGDFVCESQPNPTIVYRIQKDSETGAVQPNMNLMIESPFTSGEEFQFKGAVWTIADGVADIEKQLLTGLAFVSGFGAEVTAGFGRTVQVRLTRQNPMEGKGTWRQPVAGRASLPIALEPRGPLCVGGRRLAGNIFESERVISGAVLKGAVAQMLLRLTASKSRDVAEAVSAHEPYAALRRHFAEIRFLHARPVVHQPHPAVVKRPVAAPLSLVWTGTGLRDAVFCKTPVLLADGRAPAFQPDWKGPAEHAAIAITGEASVPMELRVRTAVDPELGRALDKSLFAYRVAAPRAKGAGRTTTEYRWLSRVDLESIADTQERARVAEDLKRIFEEFGLLGVGKLKTHCKVHYQEWTSQYEDSITPLSSDRWIVTLQTPALLVAPSQFSEPASTAELRIRLEEYWSHISGRALQLHDYFARWQLAGGEYVMSLQKSNVYQPFLLAKAGSVFVLRLGDVAREIAIGKIKEWIKKGLPLGPGVCSSFDLKGDALDWRRCAYIPQNGFGEIAVNQAIHEKLRLDAEDINAC